MTAYANLFQDFPTRCRRLLKLMEDVCHAERLDVTLLLSIASTGLVIPSERLQNGHPADDGSKIPEGIKSHNKLMNQAFSSSPLVNSSNNPNSWRYGTHTDSNWKDAPDNWKSAPLTDTQKVQQVVSIIRNALAHGNIYTKGSPITEIVFASKRMRHETGCCGIKHAFENGIQYVSATPEDFSKFIKNWLDHLWMVFKTPGQARMA
ncbi:hypothetical protein [Hydrogenophaga sp. MI9]|uniref:hypothetical protein n=1 Tax=Hydrogenophaga sp. MI9 TaxID=3453719 RepID=UPI003EEA4BDE